MKKLLPLFLLSILLFEICEGQNPLVKIWDKRFGGTKDEWLKHISKTSDGGFILGGSSWSNIGGDKSQNNWDTTMQKADYWFVKIDSNGIKQFDKRFGGTGDDFLNSLLQTKDGGYILGGHSNSGVTGDKSQPNWPGSDDNFWIVKTDVNGVKQWDKRYGGTLGEAFSSLQQTTDGGYILGGISASGIGGDKSQPNWDTISSSTDYWIIKIDSIGNRQWDKRFGGTARDELHSLQQTTDGGYILGGFTYSDSSGDISQASRDTSNYQGDYWIVKTDSLGNKQWDKRFGGTHTDELYDLKQTKDGGYILGGKSNSDSTGDFSQHTRGANDFWIIKTDSAGNKQWDKRFGGSQAEDEFGNVSQTEDQGYLLAGTSYSPISGDKTENNLGYEQTWIVKTNSLGIKQWDKTIFTYPYTNYHDEQGLALELSGGCYVFANMTQQGVGGYKTQPNWDTTCIPVCLEDFWIVKFCDTSAVGISVILNEYSTTSIYPNPFTNELIIKEREREAGGGKQVFLYDVAGKEILRSKTTSEETKLNTEGIAAGFYLLRVGGENFKVVKGN